MKMINVFLVLFHCFILGSNILLATVLNVPKDYLTIQSALNNAVSGDTVLVQPGIYKENILWPYINGIKLISAGDTSNTIIDGHNDGRCISFNYNYDIYNYVDYDTTTVIKGFKITNGVIDGHLYIANGAYGGGIYLGGKIGTGSNILLTDLLITNNRLTSDDARGGGIYCYNSGPVLTNVTIVNNKVTGGSGGGIYCHSYPYISKIILNNVNITDNEVDSEGGGIYCYNSGPVLTNVTIANNKIISGNSWANGGGICCRSYPYISKMILNNVNIIGNEVNSDSVFGNWAMGGGIYCERSSMELINVTVANNKMTGILWGYGGGIYYEGSSMELINVTVANNKMTGSLWGYGGGIYCSGSDTSKIMLTNVNVSDNKLYSDSISISMKTAMGGGIYCEGKYLTLELKNVLITSNMFNEKDASGGGIYCDDADLTLTNVTIAGNNSTNNFNIVGSGIAISRSNFILTNTILWNDNSGQEVYIDPVLGGSLTANYSAIRGGWVGTGNINTNPMFVSANDFHLQTISPCVNAGTLAGAPADDIEGNPRPLPIGSNPDMGAYEIYQTSSISELFDDNTINIYPNPSNGIINIETKNTDAGKEDLKVEITNLSGQVIYSKEFNNNTIKQIDLSNQPKGIYFLKLMNEDVVRVEKVVVE